MKKTKGKRKYLNFFDALIITAVVLSTAILAFFFLRRSRHMEVIIKVTDKNVLYLYGNPPTWFSEYFREGMIAKDGLGRKTAEIKRVYRYNTAPNKKAVYLTLDLKVDYSLASGKFSYEGKPLVIGAPIKVEFQDLLVEGLVTYVEGVVDEKRTREVLVETQIMRDSEVFPETNGVPAYIAEALDVGDVVKDSLGNILITIVDKKVEPAKKIVSDSTGNLFIRRDPLKKDIFLTLKLRVTEINNKISGSEYYLFDNVRVSVGQKIPLHLRNISIYQDMSIYPTVTKILEVR